MGETNSDKSLSEYDGIQHRVTRLGHAHMGRPEKGENCN